jgi:hypothetical protein
VSEIKIRPANPYDFNNEELEDLAEEIHREDPDLEVEVSALPERGYGVTPIEVIAVITATGGAVAAVKETAKAAQATIGWMRKRWQKDKEEGGGAPRRRVVRVLYGPDGKELRSIAIDEPDGSPQEKSVERKSEPRDRTRES